MWDPVESWVHKGSGPRGGRQRCRGTTAATLLDSITLHTLAWERGGLWAICTSKGLRKLEEGGQGVNTESKQGRLVDRHGVVSAAGLYTWTLNILYSQKTEPMQPWLGHIRIHSPTANTPANVPGGHHTISAVSEIVSTHSQSEFAQEARY